MTPARRRSPKGTRCLGHALYGHWQTTTFVCALRTRGLVAPVVLDGPINGMAFRAWVQQALVPVLQAGDIVVDPPCAAMSWHRSMGIGYP